MKNTMIYLNILVVFCLCSAEFSGQGIVTTTGGEANDSSGSFSYTIGQVVYNYHESETGDFNEGVQQPYEFLTVNVRDIEGSERVIVYPNPSSGFIKVDFTGSLKNYSHYRIVNLYGQVLIESKINDDVVIQDVLSFRNGAYILELYEEDQRKHAIRFVKQ